MGILDSYRRQVEEDKLNENFDMTGIDDEAIAKYSESDMDELRRQISQIRNDPNDIANKFRLEYPQVSESQLGDNIVTEQGKVLIKHAYCPNCGKELVSAAPVMFNPWTQEKIAKHECSCGFKANLEYAYPRVVYVDGNGNEIMAFAQ